MKLTTLLLVIALVQASAKGYSQKISLNETNAPLTKVLSDIKTQSGYTFLYTDQRLKDQKVSVTVRAATIEETLEACFKNLNINYKIVDINVFLKFKESLSDKTEVVLPQVTIEGNVTDETGQVMPGVNITIKGTNQSVPTDKNGTFRITVTDENNILIFTYIGYETQELRAKDIASGSTIILKASNTNLKEVVVNKGYYTERQALSTGNVSRVTAKEIGQQPVTDPIMALEGRVAGLEISQSSGIPGAASLVRLRGQNSIANGNDPLFIVDGVPFPSIGVQSSSLGTAVGAPSKTPGQFASGKGYSPFNLLNPQDIESIEVLKDADATAIYGSRGANGVILITTKHGKVGQTTVDVNAYSGIGKVTRTMNLLNTQQYLSMRKQALKNDGLTPDVSDYDINGTWDTTRYTNWQKELIGGTAKFNNVQANISGGNTNTQYSFSAGYSKQTSVFPGENYDTKVPLRFNLNNSSANGKFRINLSAQYISDKNIGSRFDLTSQALFLAPDAPAVYDNNGNLNWQNGTWNNPLASLLQKVSNNSNNLIGDLHLSYEVFSGLQIKANIGYTRIESNQDLQIPATYFYGPPAASRRSHQSANSYLNTLITEPQISYQKKIGRGQLDILAGVTGEKDHAKSLTLYGYNYATDTQIPIISAAPNYLITNNYESEYRYSAIYGRIGFNWQEKYLINATARRDGSSRFGPSNQFGNFGAIGMGWIFSKEKFITELLPFLSFGKLRGSYGTTGNDQIDNYQYLSTYNFATGSPYQGVVTLYPNNIGNPYFGWESVRKIEVAIELGLLKDRILIDASYYRNRTGNQLVGQALPSTTGFTSIVSNLPAIVQNTGFELNVNTINIKSKDFSWTSNLNISIPSNRLISFPDLANNATYKNTLVIGQPIYVQKKLHYTGVDPQTGNYTFQDFNGDGKISFVNGIGVDQQSFKQIAKTYFGGFNNSFKYHGIQLDIFLQFTKQTAFNYLNYFFAPGLLSNSQNQPTAVLNAWKIPGSNATTQQYTANFGSIATSAYSNLQSSDAVISDASFIRVKNVALSYQLPQKWQNCLHLKNARVYMQAQNLLTFTNYLGLDPETQGTVLPPLKMITTGIQFGL